MQWESAIFHLHSSETSEPILMKLNNSNYRPGTTHHAKQHFDPTTWVFSANSQFAMHLRVFCLIYFGHFVTPTPVDRF